LESLHKILTKVVQMYEGQNSIPKILGCRVFEMFIMLLSNSDYVKKPQVGALFRNSLSETTDPLLIEFWQLEELMGTFFGINY